MLLLHLYRLNTLFLLSRLLCLKITVCSRPLLQSRLKTSIPDSSGPPNDPHVFLKCSFSPVLGRCSVAGCSPAPPFAQLEAAGPRPRPPNPRPGHAHRSALLPVALTIFTDLCTPERQPAPDAETASVVEKKRNENIDSYDLSWFYSLFGLHLQFIITAM